MGKFTYKPYVGLGRTASVILHVLLVGSALHLKDQMLYSMEYK